MTNTSDRRTGRPRRAFGAPINTYMPFKRANGYRPKQGTREDRKQITVIFDSTTFRHLTDYAYKERISMSECVRMFCEWGLDIAKKG